MACFVVIETTDQYGRERWDVYDRNAHDVAEVTLPTAQDAEALCMRLNWQHERLSGEAIPAIISQARRAVVEGR